jgi:hypothetical protein
VVERARGKMGSITGDAEPTALCDLALWMLTVARATWSPAPSFFLIRGIWGSILCGGWFRCHGTCSTEACMCMDPGLVLVLHLTGCTG